jgi:hypothetical protein
MNLNKFKIHNLRNKFEKLKILEILIISLVAFLSLNCKNRRLTYDYIDYSDCRYNFASDTTYSIHIDSTGYFIIRYDTIQKIYVQIDSLNFRIQKDTDENKRLYFYGTLSKNEIDKLKVGFHQINQLKVDSEYHSIGSLSDIGHFDKLILKNKQKKISTLSWNGSEPQKLRQFKSIIFNIIINNMKSKAGKIYKFESLKNFYP